MSLMDRIKAKAQADKKRIVLPEGAEERTVKAAAILLRKASAMLSCWVTKRRSLPTVRI